MATIVEIDDLRKTYGSGHAALQGISLEIEEGEILALLGPNGAGKTTLISTVCGLVTPSAGRIRVGGFDTVTQWRQARGLIGLVPQEISLEPFETVANTVRLSRGLFGLKRDEAAVERVLTALSLWDKRDAQIKTLSGGMKRRVLIAKALVHAPRVLFLDEPTAGVDVELRRGMWDVVAELKAKGTTIILTTHYIEEAEAIADRVGVIDKGRLLLLEEKAALMARMGRKELRIFLRAPLAGVPARFAARDVHLEDGGETLVYGYDTKGERTGITALLADLAAEGIALKDIATRQSSLEEIFIGLLEQGQSRDGSGASGRAAS
jgi:ABC-2 type transport system ATP-binding protein